MKSILAQPSPQRSPWAPERLRQEVHTGRSKRSAARASAPRKASPANKAARRAVARSDVIFAPSILMDVMIERRWAQQKEARLRHE